jgi:hypothetical protein
MHGETAKKKRDNTVLNSFPWLFQTIEVFVISPPNTTTIFKYTGICVFPLCVTAETLTLNMLVSVFWSRNIPHDYAAEW